MGSDWGVEVESRESRVEGRELKLLNPNPFPYQPSPLDPRLPRWQGLVGY